MRCVAHEAHTSSEPSSVSRLESREPRLGWRRIDPSRISRDDQPQSAVDDVRHRASQCRVLKEAAAATIHLLSSIRAVENISLHSVCTGIAAPTARAPATCPSRRASRDSLEVCLPGAGEGPGLGHRTRSRSHKILDLGSWILDQNSVVCARHSGRPRRGMRSRGASA
jgi:hypothetical protein